MGEHVGEGQLPVVVRRAVYDHDQGDQGHAVLRGERVPQRRRAVGDDGDRHRSFSRSVTSAALASTTSPEENSTGRTVWTRSAATPAPMAAALSPPRITMWN